MMSENVPLAFSANIECADWIRLRLSPFEQYRATSIVPNGFDAYARILHPVQLPSDGRRLIRWSEVARWSGLPMNDLVQWHDVALPQLKPSSDPPWHGQGPEEGSPYVADIDALVNHLTDFTSSSERTCFCLWVGYLGGASATFALPGTPRANRPIRERPTHVVALPRREYGLVEAPLSFATALGGVSDGIHKAANLWWPEDRAWCVASEIDLRWTYVGGPSELIARILSDERVEALPAMPEDPSSSVIGGWLSDAIEAATDELLDNGSLHLEFALGSVEMTWSKEKRRDSVISSRTTGRSSSGSSSSPVRTRDRTLLRSQMRRQIERAVLLL